jgi:hypothetical protein
MISVILYGRNDAHGYNLHRRAALSLNCIAEVLTDPSDELLFVDYNTPDELPTFIEAISDTLTDHCVDLLRVLRVRAAIHDQRFAARTHLAALEPVARNVAARRSNPSNRWLLSTNTDMIFVPLNVRSMSDICRDLTDGFSALPRFELPEWLWESFPRTDPRRAVTEMGRLGPGLRLDESTIGHEWIRFDAPGDFQLILREDFVAIDGCDEEMLLGYHVDSNLSRRLLLHRGSIASLENQLSGYHCNHSRTPTVYHGPRVTNDLSRFLYLVDEAALPAQRATWGLAEETVEEVPIRQGLGARSAAVLSELIPTGPRVVSDSYRAPQPMTYDSGHVLPHAVDTLLLSSIADRVGYLGINSVLERMLRDVVDSLGFDHPLAAARFDDMTAVERIAQDASVFIIDLGVDVSQGEVSVDLRGEHHVGSGSADVLAGLAYAFPALDRLIEIERRRAEDVKHARPMMLVNSSAMFCDAYVLAQFDCSYTTLHSRVRRATVKPADQVDAVAIELGSKRGDRLLHWFGRPERGNGALNVTLGECVNIAEVKEYGGFGTGWTHPEPYGIWTEGPRAELRVGVGETPDDDFGVTLMIGMVCAGPEKPLRVTLLVGEEEVATREFAHTDVAVPWRIELPACTRAGREIDLVLLVDEPGSPLGVGWSADERRLGILLEALTLERIDRFVAVGERVLFCEGSGAERLLDDGWSPVDPTGVWTAEEEARLIVRLADSTPAGMELVLDGLAFVTNEHPRLEAEVWAGEERLGARIFRYGEAAQPFRVHLPHALLDMGRPVPLDLRLRDPARPVDLGLGRDSRRLGFHLRSLTIRRPDAQLTADGDSGPGA